MGSLSGADASKRVTEAREGTLSMDGNHAGRVFAKGCLTARLTRRAGAKAGESDPIDPRGWSIAQRIKVTLGITG